MGRSTVSSIDLFPNEAGRHAELSGRIAAALIAGAAELFAQLPIICLNFDLVIDLSGS